MKNRTTHKGALRSFERLVHSPLLDVFNAVEIGLPAQVIDQGAEYLGVSKRHFSELLQINRSSLSRWITEKRTMPKTISDRVARVARVTFLVENELGGQEEAVGWLNRNIPALGNIPPLSLLGTDAGAKLIEQLLVRAQDGIYG
jgi:putative toxin-antitoxin system antitoxin component (TIGR02293 family)